MSRRVLAGSAVLVLLLVAAGLFGRALGPSWPARFPSSFAADPEGLLAFRRLLGQLGVPNETSASGWDELRTRASRGVLVVATPLQRPPDENEAQALAAWLGRGGALLIVDDAGALERSQPLDRLLDRAGLSGRPPLNFPDFTTGSFARPEEEAASGTAVPPSGKDLDRITVHADGGLDDGASGVPLSIGAQGAVAAALATLGRGRIVRVFGPILANDRLLVGDNLEFALRLVGALRRNGPVVFDEYHHGYGGLLPGSRGIDRAALLAAGAQALLAALAYGAARGVREVPAVPAPDRRRRSSLEFVRSLASLYQRARARRHVLASELARFEREARARWEAAGAAAAGAAGTEEVAAAVAAAVAAQGRVPAERVLSVLGSAREALARSGLAEKEMLARASDLARLEREVFGGS